MSMTPDDIDRVDDSRARPVIDAILSGECGDPRGALGPLGPRPAPGGRTADPDASGREPASRDSSRTVRVFLPPALEVEARPAAEAPGGPPGWVALARVHPEGVFEGDVPGAAAGYRLRVHWDSGDTTETEDPYRFPPSLRAADFAAFHDGSETRLEELLGARSETRDGVEGTRFAVWAPRAHAVNLMGSFNGWEARRHPMFPIQDAGVWELFVPGVGSGARYKFRIRAAPVGSTGAPDSGTGRAAAVDKADPLGRRMELRPRSASVVETPTRHAWADDGWLARREDRQGPGRPLSIYEVHLGSWRRREDGTWLTYGELADTLLPYVRELGFTHVELLPVTEHPHDASWGYQTVGYFAPTSRYGDADGLRGFVDRAHALGIGVILDWVPGHFPLDAHGLARFDGRPLYEHPDPRRGAHPDWGTAIFDYGRPEVVAFLTSSARYWIETFHLDGLRLDAVASMLYLDYSRAPGEWMPNEEGGRENLEAVAFLRHLTGAIHAGFPGVLLCAEESTDWPGVTGPPEEDGLGFDLKWNMGWMNDTLAVFATEPGRRRDLHHRLTFSLHYAHAERHLLPLSHDEVVHLKGSLASRMPGSAEERLAQLRLLLGYMWTHPGAKLLFMGGELGQWSEWSEAAELPWELLERPAHRGVSDWVRDLNARYRSDPSLHALDESPEGFEWADVHDAERSVLAYYRWAPQWEDLIAVVANFSDRAWPAYRAALPDAGAYRIALDSDAPRYAGGGRTRLSGPAEEVSLHGRPASIGIHLPPFTLVALERGDPGEAADGEGGQEA